MISSLRRFLVPYSFSCCKLVLIHNIFKTEFLHHFLSILAHKYKPSTHHCLPNLYLLLSRSSTCKSRKVNMKSQFSFQGPLLYNGDLSMCTVEVRRPLTKGSEEFCWINRVIRSYNRFFQLKMTSFVWVTKVVLVTNWSYKERFHLYSSLLIYHRKYNIHIYCCYL